MKKSLTSLIAGTMLLSGCIGDPKLYKEIRDATNIEPYMVEYKIGNITNSLIVEERPVNVDVKFENTVNGSGAKVSYKTGSTIVDFDANMNIKVTTDGIEVTNIENLRLARDFGGKVLAEYIHVGQNLLSNNEYNATSKFRNAVEKAKKDLSPSLEDSTKR